MQKISIIAVGGTIDKLRSFARILKETVLRSFLNHACNSFVRSR